MPTQRPRGPITAAPSSAGAGGGDTATCVVALGGGGCTYRNDCTGAAVLRYTCAELGPAVHHSMLLAPNQVGRCAPAPIAHARARVHSAHRYMHVCMYGCIYVCMYVA